MFFFSAFQQLQVTVFTSDLLISLMKKTFGFELMFMDGKIQSEVSFTFHVLMKCLMTECIFYI